MFDLSTQQLVFLAGLLVYTCVTAWTDFRYRKIYNNTTVTMWVAGWVYQAVFFQWSGILDGLTGFAFGFGLFFVLWMIGSACGGDAKLMGALSVWLGRSLTLKVILASLILVVVGTLCLLVVGVYQQGWKKTRASYVPAEPAKGNVSAAELSESRSGRRVMAFALPVALATWSVLVMFRDQW